MAIYIILSIIGIIGILDALVVLLFPKQIRKLTLQIIKNSKKLRKIAFAELLIGIIFLLLGMVLRRS